MNRRKYPRAALPALALFLFASFAMLVSPAASGQRPEIAVQEINQVLESYESLRLDPAEALRSAREDGGVMLQTARGAFDLEVEPFDIRSDDYRGVAFGEGGVMTELTRTPSNSWRGHVRGQEGTFVRLYLDGQKFQGIIITPGETFFVEPARDLSKAAGSKEFLFYAASDVKPTDATCEEATLGGKVAAEAARSGVNATKATAAPTPDESFAPKPEVLIATEADFEFFQANGSNETATNNDIDSIITQVDGIYDAQLGVKLRVSFHSVWTTAGDPYTLTNPNSTDSNGNPVPNILSEFADYWEANRKTVTRNLAHMFTGRNIDGSTIGIAYRGALCDIPNASYGLSQSRFTTINAQRVAVTAHEIGHNFGATHTGPSSNPNDPPQQIPGCDLPDAALMQPSVSTTTGFCQFSRDQIFSHLTGTGGSCLTRLTTPGCTYTITPTAQGFPAAGGTATVNVTSNCAWGVAEGSTWITFSSEAGTGNGATNYTVAANTNTGPREAFVDIGAQKLTVRQAAAAGCSSTPINIGQTINGSLSSSDCRSGQPERPDAFIDLYTFTARAGQRIRIEMTAAVKPTGTTPPAAALDTFLYLFGPNGAILTSNDDIVLIDNTDSRIPVSGFYTVPSTGVYTIEATSFGDNDDGNYSLTLTDNSSTASVSLSSASYAVNEGTGGDGIGVDGTGFRVVTVTRSGTDTTGTATVDYATSDGTANKQKDYEQALGTLVFGPGETSKTFTVFVPDDAFAEGAETVNLTLSNPVGATLGANGTATLTINSNDATSGLSPVRAQSFNTAFFVRQQYLDFLGREPDTSGFNFWQGEINNCGADEVCKEVKRINVSAAFFLSIEFQETGYLVERTYKAAYGDATSPNVAGTVPVIRLNEFLPDTQRIGQGVIVNVGNWEAQLAANKQAYALEFVLRPRFLTAFPLTMTSAQFVDKLIQNAGITLTTPERDALITQLSSNSDVAAGRASVLRAVAENAQLRQNEFNRAFVLMQYYGYLRRNPNDPQDVDFRGWKFWLDKLNENNGNFVNAEMVKAFITADEYINRFGN